MDDIRDEVRLFYQTQTRKGMKPEIAAVETVLHYMEQYRYDRDRISARLRALESKVFAMTTRGDME